MRLTVQDFKHRKAEISVSADATSLDLKKAISEVWKVPPDGIVVLVQGDIVLEDTAKLNEHGISDGALVQVDLTYV